MSKEYIINIEGFNKFLSKYFTDETRRSITYQFVTSGAVECKEIITKEQLEQAKKDIDEESFLNDARLSDVHLYDVFAVLNELIKEKTDNEN